jgi:hypothetical protein
MNILSIISQIMDEISLRFNMNNVYHGYFQSTYWDGEDAFWSFMWRRSKSVGMRLVAKSTIGMSVGVTPNLIPTLKTEIFREP